MSTKLSKCCVSGHLHQGTATGKEETIAGLKAYVAGDNKAKTILIITDIFGYDLNNVKILADEYAKTGDFRVVVPDFFEGDSINSKHLKGILPLHSDPVLSEDEQKAKKGAAFGEMGPWLKRHTDDVVKPLFTKVTEALKKDSKTLGVVGFCWGGRHAIGMGGAGSKFDAIVAMHPSNTEFPASFENIEKPTLIQVGDEDTMFPFEQVQVVKGDILPKKSECELIVYPGAVHGFAVRGDLNNDAEKQIKEAATNAALDFLQKHLA